MQTKGIVFITAVVVVLTIISVWLLRLGQRQPNEDSLPSVDFEANSYGQTAESIIMQLTSPAFENNQNVPLLYTCDGKDINPPLIIKNVPDAAKSLALVVDDPDAPSGTWIHWLVWNISPETQEIYEDSLPPGAVQGKNSFGKLAYGGPCPPNGVHRYFFKLYALDTLLPLTQADIDQFLEVAQEHIIDYAELVGLYQRLN